MRRVFVIGSLGSGKSRVLKVLGARGVPGIDLDELGHVALKDARVRAQLADAFGAQVLNADGALDRSSLARVAFASAENTAQLEAIQFPAIFNLLQQRCKSLEEQSCPACLVEASSLRTREGCGLGPADTVLAVLAPRDLCLSRACARGMGEADARRRLAQQISDDDRCALADFCLCNQAGREEFDASVVAWWQGFCRQCRIDATWFERRAAAVFASCKTEGEC